MKERVELHCHTKMSAMAGVADVSGIILQASIMEMPAIVITDNDTVQAFPEAYRYWLGEVSENNDIKVLLGMEASLDGYRVIMIPKNTKGMKEMYRLLSECLDTEDQKVKITKSLLSGKREDFLIGSCAQGGEVSKAVFKNQPDEVVRDIIGFYDFVEVEPVCNYIYTIDDSLKTETFNAKKIKENIKRIVQIGKEESVPVIASANVYYKYERDIEAFKVLRFANGIKDPKEWEPKHYLMSTEEMLEEFSFLGAEGAEEIVVDNTCEIADKSEVVRPVSARRQYPEYPDAEKKVSEICYKRARELYGDELPHTVKDRLGYELAGIKEGGFATIYMIAYELVKMSNEAGYPVGSRGSSSASFVAYLMGITGINPLPEEFNGYDIPVETFLGFDLDKEPVFDLNFAGEYRSEAEKSLSNMKGVGSICRAGTIYVIATKLAKTYTDEYYKKRIDYKDESMMTNVAKTIEGTRRQDGTRPGEVIVVPERVDIFAYTPLIFRKTDEIPSTFMNYHDFDGQLLQIGLLGHTAPSLLKYLSDETGVDPSVIRTDDERVLSLFLDTKALGIEPEMIGGVSVGTLGAPEFGSAFARDVLKIVRPESFPDIIKMTGMLHGTGVWEGNAKEIVKANVARFSECIGNRDDIMLFLIDKGIYREEAYDIMEYVRKGKCKNGLRQDWIDDMRNAGVPEWYIESCKKIRYLFPKAHSVGYALMSWRLLWYKLNYPEIFYKGWLKYRAHEVDMKFVKKGYEYAKTEYEELLESVNEIGEHPELMDEILTVMEMQARGVGEKCPPCFNHGGI